MDGNLIYYIFIFVSALLYSMQFLFNKKFESESGTGFEATMLFLIYSSLVMAAGLFIIKGFKLEISLFSILMAACYSAVNILCICVSLKALSVVNLSKYSIYMMLGGMLLPALYGMIFNDEAITVQKTVCILFIILSLFFTYEKGKGSFKEKLYFALVFILNGMYGVVSSIHQQAPESFNIVDSFSFMALSGIISLIVCTVIYVIKAKKLPLVNIKSVRFPAGFALCNGTAEVLVFMALKYIDSSVQFPIITGGTIAFSAVISFMLGEKPGARNIIAVVIAFAASICMAI